MEGVEDVSVEFAKRRVEIVFDRKVVASERIVQTAKGLGFTLVESGSTENGHEPPKRE